MNIFYNHVQLNSILFVFKDAEVLATQSNEILTAIVHGMKREEPSNHVRLAATTALLNSLEFTKANFDKEVRSISLSVNLLLITYIHIFDLHRLSAISLC